MAIVKRFNVNKEKATLDAEIIENMSANDVSYDASTQYDENTVGNKLSELEKEVIYDVTANNDGVTFDSLSVLLSSENLSTLIPVDVRCGGMSIRFIKSSDNKYVQYFCNSQTFATNVGAWEKINLKEELNEQIFEFYTSDLSSILTWETGGIDGNTGANTNYEDTIVRSNYIRVNNKTTFASINFLTKNSSAFIASYKVDGTYVKEKSVLGDGSTKNTSLWVYDEDIYYVRFCVYYNQKEKVKLATNAKVSYYGRDAKNKLDDKITSIDASLLLKTDKTEIAKLQIIDTISAKDNYSWTYGAINFGTGVATEESAATARSFSDFIPVTSNTILSGIVSATYLCAVAAYSSDSESSYLMSQSLNGGSEKTVDLSSWQYHSSVKFIRLCCTNKTIANISITNNIEGQKSYDVLKEAIATTATEIANKANTNDVVSNDSVIYKFTKGVNLYDVFKNHFDAHIPNFNTGIRQDTEHAAFTSTPGYIAVEEGTLITIDTSVNQYVATIACYDSSFNYLKEKSCINQSGDFTIQTGVSYIILTFSKTALSKIARIKYGKCWIDGGNAASLGIEQTVKTIDYPLTESEQKSARTNIGAGSEVNEDSLLFVNYSARNIISKLQYQSEVALAKSFPLHYFDIMQRINDRYDFGSIALSSTFIVPSSGNVDISVNDASVISDSLQSFPTTTYICVGTIDFYDRYRVVSISGNTITAELVENNLGIVGSVMPATTEMNITVGSSSCMVTTRVFLYNDILCYEANEMPFSLRGGDTVHPNNTGFQYVADIIKETILSRYSVPTRIIAFGDSWTAMDNAWPSKFSLTGCTVRDVNTSPITAKSGNRIEQIMDLFSTFMQTYEPLEGDVFVFLFGTNNLFPLYTYHTQQSAGITKMQDIINHDYVRVIRKACDTISQTLPNGNWFVGGGHALSFGPSVNKNINWK